MRLCFCFFLVFCCCFADDAITRIGQREETSITCAKEVGGERGEPLALPELGSRDVDEWNIHTQVHMNNACVREVVGSNHHWPGSLEARPRSSKVVDEEQRPWLQEAYGATSGKEKADSRV